MRRSIRRNALRLLRPSLADFGDVMDVMDTMDVTF
jgi:hypothetical protein